MTVAGSLRRFVLLSFMLAAALGFSALGVWQLERRAWKIDLIQRIESRIHAPAVAAPARERWPSIGASDAYRRVHVEGRFLLDRETLVQAVTEKGPGWWVMTPLETDEGDIILVNRGFVPLERRDPATRLRGNPGQKVDVGGLLCITEPRGGFLRANDPDADRWYSRDVEAIAAARHLTGAAPYFIDADAAPNTGGWPLGGLTVIAFDNNHLIYALTWFALALITSGAALLTMREDWRLRMKGLNSRTVPRLHNC